MAKELAQTVGGKRIALLVAILAAFAVFASLGNQLGTKQAGATVNAGPTLAGLPATGSGGDSFDVTSTAGSNAASGDFNILVTTDAGLDVTDGACNAGGEESVTDNSVNCTFDPGSNRVNTTSITIGKAANCSDSETLEVQTTAQDGDNQVSTSDSIDVLYPCVDLDKTVSINGPDSYNCSLPCTGVYTIALNNDGDAAAENGTFVDVLDSRLLITDVQVVNASNGAVATCEFQNSPVPAVQCSNIDLPAPSGLDIKIFFTMSSSNIPVAQDDEGYTVHNYLGDENTPVAPLEDPIGTAVCFDEITPCLEDVDDLGVDDDSRAAFNFGGQASATLEKWSSPSSVSSVPVSAFDWIFRVTNTGTVPLTNMTLTDGQLDGGTGFASADVQTFSGSLAEACVVTAGTPGALACDFNVDPAGPAGPIGQLDPGETLTIVVHMHTAGGPAPDGTNIDNDVTFDATEIQEIEADGTLEIDNDPILSISKVATNATVGYASTGAAANTFTVTVTNNGAVPAAGVTVADVLPAGLVSATNTCTGALPSIAANGGTQSCTVTGVFIDPAVTVAAGAVFANTASATFNGDTITDTATVTAVAPSISISKTATTGTVDAGANGVHAFDVTVSNNGSSASGTIVLADVLPAGLTLASVSGGGCATLPCNLASLAPGGSVTVQINVNVSASLTDGTVLTNVATASSPVGQANPAFLVADDASVTVRAPQITITKTNAPTIVGVNGTVTSTIVVGNSGSLPVTITGVVDTLAAGTSYIASGSTASCNAAGLVVTCGGGTIQPGGSITVTVKFNAGSTPGVKTNTATTTNSSGAANPSAQASVTVVATPAGGLVHVDVDAGSEAAGHNSSNKPDNNQVLHDPGSSENQVALQDDIDDATGSMHTVCLVNATLGANDQNDIVWNIVPTPGSSATATNVTKSVKALVDNQYSDAEANCVSWRSAGVGGQTITATYTVTGDTFYWAGANGVDIPLIKEWNDIDVTKIVSVLGNIGATIFNNTQELANWTSASPAGTCVRDHDVSASDVNCIDRANVDGSVFGIAGSRIVTGDLAGNLIAGNASFIEYALGDHKDYAGAIDGVKQTFAVSGTCGSVRIENPVTGQVAVLFPGDSVTVLNSDKGVGFQITPTDDGSVVTTVFNADCSAGETTTVTITSTEDVQLRSDIDTAPAEVVTIVWQQAPPPAKQIILAWAGQRVILEHDWRINGAGAAYDVNSASIPADPAAGNLCPVGQDNEGGEFLAHYIRGTGPGNFLPSLGANIIGNDDATVWVLNNVDQVNDDQNVDDGNLNCISRVLYESEDPGEVDIELFIDGEDGLNLSKVAFVVYYMKFESIDLSLVSQVSKPNHNAPARSFPVPNPTSGADWGDYAPGNPWDASKDDADDAVDWNVSKDLLVRGRVKGWFINSNPSGRAADSSNPLNVLPANRWVMPDDWDLLAGGPHGEEVSGTAETFRPSYDIMMAPNNVGIGTGVPFLCDTPIGGCSENLIVGGTTTAPTYAQAYDVVAPVEGPYSLLDIVGPTSAALSNLIPQTVRNTIVRDRDVDWWDAPMPAAIVSVELRGSGFLKQVSKEDVYWTGTVNGHYGTVATGGQDFTNPFYVINIPDSMFIPAIAAGGGFLWDSWGTDGAGGLGQGVYEFWTANPNFLGYGLAITNKGQANYNHAFGVDTTLTDAQRSELADIRVAYGALSTDAVIRAEARSIGRALVVFTDNHGEFMVTTNGDFNLTYADCDTNVFGGGKHCAKDDKVGASTINATVDYPDFRGKHFPIKSSDVKVTWLWGGYKEVTIENGETDQFKYIVFRAVDRDGFCSQVLPGSVSLHPVLSSWDALFKVGANDPVESVDFLIDSGEGIIVGQSGGGTINDGKQFATGVTTFSTAVNTTIKEFAPINGSTDECQAWIRVSNSLLGILNVLSTAHDDEGDIGFDRIIDFSSTDTYQLTFRWSLITWFGKDGISPSDALKGTVGTGANNIFDQVTAVYGWNQASQTWLGFFPAGVSVPGANDLTALKNGSAYWVAIKGPDPVTWTIGTNVN